MKSPTTVLHKTGKEHDISSVEFDPTLGSLRFLMLDAQKCEKIGDILEGQLRNNVEGRQPIPYSFGEETDTTITVKGVNTALVQLINFLVTEYRRLLPESTIEAVKKGLNPKVIQSSMYSISGENGKSQAEGDNAHEGEHSNTKGDNTGCAML